MILTDARTYLARLTRSGADDGRYSPTDLDLALIDVGTEFCRLTQIVRSTTTVAAASGSYTVTFSGITGFRPERLLRARVRDDDAIGDLKLVGGEEVDDLQAADDGADIPTHLGFLTTTTAEVWPEPDAAYTIDVYTWDAFTAITPGGSSVTLNIPDDVIYQVLRFAADYAMRANVSDRAMFFATGGAFAAFCAECRGRGSTQGQTISRDSLRPGQMVEDPSLYGVD